MQCRGVEVGAEPSAFIRKRGKERGRFLGGFLQLELGDAPSSVASTGEPFSSGHDRGEVSLRKVTASCSVHHLHIPISSEMMSWLLNLSISSGLALPDIFENFQLVQVLPIKYNFFSDDSDNKWKYFWPFIIYSSCFLKNKLRYFSYMYTMYLIVSNPHFWPPTPPNLPEPTGHCYASLSSLELCIDKLTWQVKFFFKQYLIMNWHSELGSGGAHL